MTMKRLLVLLLAASGAFTHAAEQAYPTRPVRLISTYPPGGGNDTVARAIAQRLTEAYGQQVIVDNRPGANGVIGCEIVARSPPDGYTLLMASIASHAINPALYPKIPYDPVKDFAGVSLLGTTVNILVVHPSIPARTVKELVAYAKSHPGLTYGSNGIGSSQHLAGALFKSAFGLDIVHVPYKGTGPMTIDLLAGQIAFSFGNATAVLQHVKAKKLVALGVTSLKRQPSLPDLPAIAEFSPGFEATSWWGLVAPRATPRAVIASLNGQVVRALDSADMKTFMNSVGAEPAPTTPEAFDAFARAERIKWARVVKESGARAE
jgi:tripartite-type tricarboxylate transporter receptor subunit TctC